MRKHRPLGTGSTIRHLIYRNNIVDQQGDHRRRLDSLESRTLTVDVAADKYQRRKQEIYLDGWGQENVSASQTAVTLTRWGAAWRTSPALTRAGYLAGLLLRTSAARTAGTLTVEVYIDGVASGFSAQINDEDTQFVEEEAAAGEYSFDAGAAITLRITTDGSWAPTTADLEAAIVISTE